MRARGSQQLTIVLSFILLLSAIIKRAAWAKSQGVSYLAAYRWYRAGTMPVRCYQAPTGTIIVDVEGTAVDSGQPTASPTRAGVALYARVSGQDQKADLERQLARLRKHSRTIGLPVVREIKEIGSGLNGHRKQLAALLADIDVTTIVVEHRDRLMRFGADYVAAAMAASGRRLIVIDDGEMKDDLVQDMIDVMTSFCARLDGRRSASRRALAGVSAMESHDR